jgi:CHAT domain-containing protein
MRNLKGAIASCLAAGFGAILSSAGQATCLTAMPALPPINSAAPLAERYTALRLNQDWAHDDVYVPDWRRLIDDIRRDAAAPPELLAMANAQLAIALTDEPTLHERLKYAEEAEKIVQANGLADRPSHVEILTALSFKELTEGKADLAATHGEAAVAAARRHFGTDSWEYARALSAAGSATYALGRYEDSRGYMAISEEIALKCLPANDWRIVDRISGHAVLLSATGRLDEAITEHFNAVNHAILYPSNDQESIIYALFNLGSSLRNAMRLGEAEIVLRRTIDRAVRTAPHAYAIRAQALAKFANVLDLEGHHREAEAMWLEAGATYKLTGDRANPTARAAVMQRAADSAERRGDLPLALARRREALTLLGGAVAADHPDVARAKLEYAVTLMNAGNLAEAGPLADAAISVVRKAFGEADPIRIGAGIAYARIVAATRGAEQGYAIAAPLEQRLEGLLLDGATSRGDLINYGPLFASIFADYADLALATGRQDAAFRAVQLANMSQIVLVTTDMATRAATKDDHARALITALQDAVRRRRVIERQRSLAISANQTDRVAALNGQIEKADGDARHAAAELDADFPSLRALGRPTPETLATIRSQLGPRDILLAPLVTSSGTLAIAVTRDGMVWHKSASGTARMEALVTRIRTSVDQARKADSHARFDLSAARSLYAALIPAELRPAFDAHPSVQYYASGSLATIPLALLVGPSSKKSVAWLVRSHDIIVRATLAPTQQRAAVEKPRRFLGVGAPTLAAAPVQLAANEPIFRDGVVDRNRIAGLPALPTAKRELTRMNGIIGGQANVVLAGSAATEAAFKALPLDQFNVIAFATHGLVAGDVAGLSEPAIVMTPPGLQNGGDDGLLTASEIAGLKLDADWVILSACNTASGGGGNPEYAGLASAFVQAGARSLLVSHWPVRDDAAARLTIETVRGTQAGASRAVALQRAMVRLMSDKSVRGGDNPAVWAPFVLVGQ